MVISSSARTLWLASLAGAMLLAAAPETRADEPDAGTRAYAERIAATVCGTCHGRTGNSEQPKFPRLAGQNANYLAAQLKAFRAQTRGDPDAIAYMWGMASQLDDATIEALADTSELDKQAAAKLATETCANCHGVGGRSTAATSTGSSRHGCACPAILFERYKFRVANRVSSSRNLCDRLRTI